MEKLNGAIDDALKFLEANQSADKDEYEKRQKDLEAVAMPIMTKLYQQGGGGGMPGNFPGGPEPCLTGLLCSPFTGLSRLEQLPDELLGAIFSHLRRDGQPSPAGSPPAAHSLYSSS
nr:hypothetical protein [Algoriphagus sp.]